MVKKAVPGGKFVPNPRGLAALRVGPQMAAMVKAKAEEAAEAARDLAPVDTGAYKASIEAESGIEDGVAKGRVNAHAWYSGFVEFGSLRHTAQHVLTRAAESLGLKVTAGRQ